eukprot:scaffold27136_cov118-Isochrysis_galbana.AAC.5
MSNSQPPTAPCMPEGSEEECALCIVVLCSHFACFARGLGAGTATLAHGSTERSLHGQVPKAKSNALSLAPSKPRSLAPQPSHTMAHARQAQRWSLCVPRLYMSSCLEVRSSSHTLPASRSHSRSLSSGCANGRWRRLSSSSRSIAASCR